MVVSSSTQTPGTTLGRSEAQDNKPQEEKFDNVDWRRLNRRKHHRDRVQVRVEPEDVEEDGDRDEARGDVRGEARGEARGENRVENHGKNENGRDKWQFDRREFQSI